MAFPLIPVALASGVGLLLLLSSKKSSAAPSGPVGPVNPNGPVGPVRPKVYPNAPVGSGRGTVAPACGPGDGADCSLGIVLRSSPNTDPSTLIAPKSSAPNSPHLVTGDVAVILEQGVADQSNPPTTRVWWRVISPTGGQGYASAIDPQGRSNFTNVSAPTAGGGGGEQPIQTFAGVGAALAQPRLMRCKSPTGCWLRPVPSFAQRSALVVPSGARVAVLSARGGWAFVNYNNGRQNARGWIPADSLA